jgi:hypothetical protein
MKKDNKKALYESIMSSVAKEVKKALNESNVETSIIDDLKSDIESWASDHFRPSNWDDRQNYINDLEAMADMGNDMIANDCYEDLADEYESEIGADRLEEIINEVLAKEAKYWLNVASYDDDDEDCDHNAYEGEAITYDDIIDVVEGENYQEIIDEEGEAWGERVLDYIKCPVNGAGVYDACVEIAERLLNGEDPDDLRAEIGEDEI